MEPWLLDRDWNPEFQRMRMTTCRLSIRLLEIHGLSESTLPTASTACAAPAPSMEASLLPSAPSRT